MANWKTWDPSKQDAWSEFGDCDCRLKERTDEGKSCTCAVEWRARRGRVFPRTRGRKGVVYLYLMYARMRLAVADLTITVSPSTSRIQRGPLVAIGATQGQGLGSPPPPWPGLRRLNLLHATVHLVLCSAAPAALAGVTTSSNRDRVRLSSVAFSIRAPLPLLRALRQCANWQ